MGGLSARFPVFLCFFVASGPELRPGDYMGPLRWNLLEKRVPLFVGGTGRIVVPLL